MRRYAPSKAEIAAVDSTDPDELDTLAAHTNKFVRSRVAKNDATQAHTLARLATDEDDYVRSAAARHRNTSTETLAIMSSTNDTSPYVRRALAANQNAPAAVLTPSAGDDYITRRTIARNPATDVETLRLLATDRDTMVVEAVAMNPSTPENVLLSLVGHPLFSVAEALSRRNFDPNNPAVRWRTITVRRAIGRRYETEEKRVPIQCGGRFSPALIEAMAASPHQVLRKTAASQPDASHEVLSALVCDEEMWVRARVAENPGAPAVLITSMAQIESEPRLVAMLAARADLPDEAIVAIAARRVTTAHEALPAGSVEVLLSHADPQVRATAVRVVPTEASTQWERMLADEVEVVRVAASSACPLDMLERQTTHDCRKVRATVADRTSNPDVLHTLASDPEVTVRRRVVKNPSCPAEAMMMLAGDGDQRVRAHAAARFMDALTRQPGTF